MQFDDPSIFLQQHKSVPKKTNKRISIKNKVQELPNEDSVNKEIKSSQRPPPKSKQDSIIQLATTKGSTAEAANSSKNNVTTQGKQASVIASCLKKVSNLNLEKEIEKVSIDDVKGGLETIIDTGGTIVNVLDTVGLDQVTFTEDLSNLMGDLEVADNLLKTALFAKSLYEAGTHTKDLLKLNSLQKELVIAKEENNEQEVKKLEEEITELEEKIAEDSEAYKEAIKYTIKEGKLVATVAGKTVLASTLGVLLNTWDLYDDIKEIKEAFSEADQIGDECKELCDFAKELLKTGDLTESQRGLINLKIDAKESQIKDLAIKASAGSIGVASTLLGATSGGLGVAVAVGAPAIAGGVLISATGVGAVVLGAAATVTGTSYAVYKNKEIIANRGKQALLVTEKEAHVISKLSENANIKKTERIFKQTTASFGQTIDALQEEMTALNESIEDHQNYAANIKEKLGEKYLNEVKKKFVGKDSVSIQKSNYNQFMEPAKKKYGDLYTAAYQKYEQNKTKSNRKKLEKAEKNFQTIDDRAQALGYHITQGEILELKNQKITLAKRLSKANDNLKKSYEEHSFKIQTRKKTIAQNKKMITLIEQKLQILKKERETLKISGLFVDKSKEDIENELATLENTMQEEGLDQMKNFLEDRGIDTSAFDKNPRACLVDFIKAKEITLK